MFPWTRFPAVYGPGVSWLSFRALDTGKSPGPLCSLNSLDSPLPRKSFRPIPSRQSFGSECSWKTCKEIWLCHGKCTLKKLANLFASLPFLIWLNLPYFRFIIISRYFCYQRKPSFGDFFPFISNFVHQKKREIASNSATFQNRWILIMNFWAKGRFQICQIQCCLGEECTKELGWVIRWNCISLVLGWIEGFG